MDIHKMNIVTKLLILLWISLGTKNSWSCSLKSNYKYYVLSGSVAALLEEFDILDSPDVLGVSSFAPVLSHNGHQIEGGIFAKLPKVDQKTIIFYDHSDDLKKMLAKTKGHKIDINLRSISAYDATLKLLKDVISYLNDCSTEIDGIKKYAEYTKNRVNSLQRVGKYYFFLGEVKKVRKPHYIISNDGFIIDLKRNSSFLSYPTSSAYTAWSQKVLKSNSDAILVGLKSEAKVSQWISNDNLININYYGGLTPGLSQLKFLNFFINRLIKNEN